tara:strand:- start:7759 stop:8880 length:1122 start_codon:yes stop_codon:yes gene_type:complete
MFFPLAREFFGDARGDALLGVQNNISTQFPQYSTSSFTLEDLEIAGGIITTDYINVETQVPLWLRERNETPALNAKLVPLFQKYYDWLYSENGSQYILEDRFANIKDIDNCPDELVRHFLSLYAPDFNEISNFDFIGTQNIRNFLRSIQDRVYAIKGTRQSIAYFFITLFDSTGVNITGFDNEAGACMIEVAFQDGESPDDDIWNEIVRLYKLMMHPVGIDLNISRGGDNVNEGSQQLQGGDSGGHDGDVPLFTAWEELTYGDGAYDGTGTAGEISIIGNYFSYTLGDTLDIAATAGCSGATIHSGITGGATGNTYTNMTTYAFPDWSVNAIAGTSFGLINTYDFAYLQAASGNTSPNDGRADNHACPVGGFT